MKSPQIVVYKNPWSGSLVFDVSRATDINHSQILNPENPDERREYAAILIGHLKYKYNSKHSFTITGAVSKDFVKNSANENSNDLQPKNIRIGYAYQSPFRFLGSLPIEWPLSVSLPTTELARDMGMIASFRIKPSLTWPFLDIYSFIYAHETNINFNHPTDELTSQDLILENSSMSFLHTLIFTAQLNEIVSFSQSAGLTFLTQNLRYPLGMDQTGSSFNISTGVSFYFKPHYSIDVMLSQSSPLQGNGAGATRVYEDNSFRPYHIAQSTWAVTGTYLF